LLKIFYKKHYKHESGLIIKKVRFISNKLIMDDKFISVIITVSIIVIVVSAYITWLILKTKK